MTVAVSVCVDPPPPELNVAVEVTVAAAGAAGRPSVVGRVAPVMVPTMTPLDPVDTSMAR